MAKIMSSSTILPPRELYSECEYSPGKRNSPRATNNDHIYKIKVAGYFKFSYYKAYWHKNKLL